MRGELILGACLLAAISGCGGSGGGSAEPASAGDVRGQLTRLETNGPLEQSSVLAVEVLDQERGIWCFRVGHRYRAFDDVPWGAQTETGACKEFYRDPAVGVVEIPVPDPWKEELQRDGRWPSYVTEPSLPAG